MQKNASLDLLLGDYKKAIIRLSIPNMISMLVQTIYNLVDAIWVAGLGTVDLAAMGFFFPIFMIVMSIATGITIGTNSAISRKIGAKDYNSARSIAEHSLLLALIIGILTMVFGILSLKTVLVGIGATGKALEKAYEYGFIIYIFTLPLMFNNTAIGILRGEGDSKRPMYAVISSSILNIVLDPILIYTFKLGISGAAWATGVSILFAFFILSHLLFVSKSTFLRISFKNFSYNSLFIKDTLFVGFPTALAQITMSVAIYVLNIFVAKVGGNTGIATFTAAWRIINLGTLTIIGISSAVTSVTGVAYGAKDVARLKNSLTYAIRFGEIFGISIMVLIFVFARQLAFLFSYTKSSTSLLENIAQALRILCLFLPGTPFGMLTSGMFQGIGQGFKSLATTILRTMIFQIFWTWIFVDVFKTGLSGVWWGIVVGNATASMVTYTWGKITIEKLKIKFENSKS